MARCVIMVCCEIIVTFLLTLVVGVVQREWSVVLARCVVMVCCAVAMTYFIDPSGMCCPTRMECSNDVLWDHCDILL